MWRYSFCSDIAARIAEGANCGKKILSLFVCKGSGKRYSGPVSDESENKPVVQEHESEESKTIWTTWNIVSFVLWITFLVAVLSVFALWLISGMAVDIQRNWRDLMK